MKKILKIFIICIGIIFLVLLILFLIFRVKDDSKILGKWIYKYTYKVNGELKYTEEDGMESYIKFYKNNRYKTGDYASDVVEKGFYIETKKGVYLINKGEWLYKKNSTLKTEIKNGKKVLFDMDFYNVLIKES